MKIITNLSRIVVLFAFVLVSMTLSSSSPAAVRAQAGQPTPDLISEVTDQQNAVAMNVSAPVPGGPGFLTLGTIDFQPANSASQYFTVPGRFYNSGVEPEIYMAIPHLPQGAIVNQVVVYYKNNYTQSIVCIFIRFDLLDSSPVFISTIAIPPAGTDPQSLAVPVTADPVDNSQYQYQVWLSLPASSQADISGVRIDYAYPISLPVILK